jgi:hypothetical protein
MASVTGTAKASSVFNQALTSGFFSGNTRSISTSNQAQFANGTAADQIDLIGVGAWSLSASGSQVVDLTTDLVDGNGAAVNFARIRHWMISVVTNAGTDGSIVTFAADATNGCTNLISTGGIPIPASTPNNNAWLSLAGPNTTATVITSTNKRVKFTANSTTSTTVYLIAVGASV